MFDLILDKVDRPYRKSTKGTTTVSLFVHVVLITCIFVVPLLYATDALPEVPVMMAFVSAAPEAPPPPPPPPPPPSAAPSQVRAMAAPTSSNPNAAPLEAPPEVKPEPPAPPSSASLLGGVEGGIEGGIVGGIVGGLVAAPPPPPPPPPPPTPAPRGPVRIGGLVVAPALVRRVEPEYPAIAVAAQVEGLVILEATVGVDGHVQDVRIMRSQSLLDRAAIMAVSQWRYAPLMLNGTPTRFVLTVTLNFALKRPATVTKDVG